MSKQLTLIVAFVIYAIALYELVVRNAPDGRWWIAPLVAWLCSPLLLGVLRLTLEHRIPGGLFNPKTQAWSFLFGDWIFLPVSLAAFAWGASKLADEAGFGFVAYDSYGWQRLCMLIGVAAGFAFNAMDRKAYAEAGAHDALFSPTKIAHDFVAYPVLLASLLFLGVPLLGALGNAWPMVTIGLAGILLWGAMAAHDVMHPPHPFDLHPAWDGVKFEPREYVPRNF